jgi:16S rRNA (guanine527-N7)-methyltransferase
MNLVLLESIAKKGAFLEQVVSTLGLEDVTIIVDRAENLGHDMAHRRQYDWAVARAVAHLSPLLEYLLPFCRIGGHALAQKGVRALEELSDAREAVRILGGRVSEQFPVTSSAGTDAYLIVIEKIKETPEKYPRRAGIPLKRPL